MPPKAKKPQPRSRGQIVARGDRKWLIRVYLGTDTTGKRMYHNQTVEGTYRQAEEAMTKVLREQDTKTYVAPAKQSLADYLTTWMQTKVDVSAKVRDDYALRLRKDVVTVLGLVRLDAVTPQMISRLYASLVSERGLSPRTAQYTHTILSQAMKQAVTWGLLSKNPCDTATKSWSKRTVKGQEMAVFTPEQVNTLLESSAGDRWHALWRVLLTTGLRPSEALALKWSDLEGSTLVIQRTLIETRPGYYEPSEVLKTESSRRRINISPETVACLTHHKAKQNVEALKGGESYKREGWMFASSVGTHLDVRNVRRWWKGSLVAAKLPEVRLYDTRHTHITHLLTAGVHVKAVAARAGHANPNVTLQVYAHVLPEVDSMSASVVEQMLAKAAAKPQAVAL